ncbi:MAG: ABC transporter permease [Anaerolineales bacterium]|nr:MAG: ABC transporter permease [Anaerolineales bacterium]
MILKNLLRRKTRSLLTIVGIGIGIAAMVALGAIADGLEEGYTAMLTGSQGDLIVTQADAADISAAAVDETVGQQLETLPEVVDVTGMLQSIVTAEGARYFMLFGYDPQSFAIEHFKIVEGEGLSDSKQVIIGKIAAENFKKGVGDSLKLFGSAFRIVGIYETGDGLEEGGGVISLSDAQVLFSKPHQVALYTLRLKPGADVEELRRKIERRIPDVITSQSDQVANTQETIQIVRGFAWGIAFIAILIGAVGMMNTVLMSVFERTREIGVLRSLGWRKGRVLGLIIGESLALSLIGGLTGTALGVAAVRALGSSPATGGLLQGRFSPGLFIQALVIALILGALGGFYPAWRASQLTPLEALRYEGGLTSSGGKGSKGWALPFGVVKLPMTARNLFRRRTRTLLTIVGIGISVAVIVGLQGFTEGFVAQFETMMGGGGQADLMAVEADISDMEYSSIDERVGKKLVTVPGVKYVSGTVFGFLTDPQMTYLIIWGYHPGEYAIRQFRIVEGEGLSANRQIILGKTAAETMDKKVGQTVKILDSNFRIVGIYETGTGFLDISGVIALREAQKLFRKPRQVGWYAIKLEDPKEADRIIAHLEANFPEISVSKTSELAEALPDFKTMQTMETAISVLAILVGGIGMMNTVFMSVFERTREIGSLRALGWRKRRVLGLILRESLLLSLVSGVVGIMGGVLLGQIGSLAQGFGSLFQGHFGPPLLIRALVMALVLGAVAGLYPAWWASRLSPVEALRYE